MKRVPSQWRLPLGLSAAAVVGLGVAAGAVHEVGNQGTTTDVQPFLTKTGPTRTKMVMKKITIHVPPRVVHRNGKTITIPGHTIVRNVAVSVPVAVPEPGPTRTITGPGGTQTVIRTITGPTTTRPGSTVTQPGSTVTQPGTTITEPGTTVTGPGSTVFSTVISTIVSTITVSAPPSS